MIDYPKGRILQESNNDRIIFYNRNRLINLTIDDNKDIIEVGRSFKLLSRRTTGDFAGYGIVLDSEYNWEIVKDKEHFTVLVPSRKD